MIRNIFIICLLVAVSACQKESNGPGLQPLQPVPASPVTTDRTEKQQIFSAAPVHEYYAGSCKMSLRIFNSSAFTESQAVEARVRIRGGNLTGSSTVFSQEVAIYNQNRWVEINIPESAYIFVTLLEVSVPFGPTDFVRIETGEFGYNERQVVMSAIDNRFYLNTEQPAHFEKFPPFNDSYRYECAPWCTWRIDYSVGGDPMTQDGPNLAFRWNFSGIDGIIKAFQLSPNTSGSKAVYPLTSSVIPLVYHCEASQPASDPPPFCYEIHSQDNTVYPPQTPAPQPPYLYSLSYGLSPNMTCDAVCKMIPETINIPQCEHK